MIGEVAGEPELALFREIFGERVVAPPALGITFVRCAWCGARLEPEPAEHGSIQDGDVSDGLCPPCDRDWRAREGLPPRILGLVILLVPSAILWAGSAGAVAA